MINRPLRAVLILGYLMAMAALMWWSASLYENYYQGQMQAQAQRHLVIYANSLRLTIDRYSRIPFIVSIDRQVQHLLNNTQDFQKGQEVSRYLQRINGGDHSTMIFVMDVTGKVIASSNWDDSDSLVGQSLHFRPYFQDALENGQGQFLGVGVESEVPRFFLSRSVEMLHGKLGVIVVGIDLSGLEETWSTSGEQVALGDNNGVLFLAGEESWRFRLLKPMTADVERYFLETWQYYGADLRPLQPHYPYRDIRDGDEITVPVKGAVGGVGKFLVTALPLPDYDWTVYAFADLKFVPYRGLAAAVGMGLALLCFLLLGMFIYQRRLTIVAKLQALNVLEERVEERTRELSEANQRLSREITERQKAEHTLKDTQEQLVQTGKLAALGQMSTILAHEINQPLTAMRTYADATLHLMDLGEEAKARGNVEKVADLTRKLAEITRNLKSFARKQPGKAEPVSVVQALESALDLTAAKMGRNGIRVEKKIPRQDIKIVGDDIRLELVFVNLIANAVDAMATASDKVLVIIIARRDDRVEIIFEDNGDGINKEAGDHIFDPFYSTKDAGEGLGMGLSLSAWIIENFGGEIKAENKKDGGARFILRLIEADKESPL